MTATSPVLNEHYYDGGFIVSEASGLRSREMGSIANGTGADFDLDAGLVLARKAGSGSAGAIVGTGNGAMGTVTVTGAAMPGVYTLRITAAATNAGNFEVIAPDGELVGVGAVGVAFNAGGLSFTLADGSSDFVVGDTIPITVTDSAGYVPYSTTSGPAVAVLYNRARVIAGGSSKVTVVRRSAEVNSAELRWDATILGSGSVVALKAAALNSLSQAGIIAR